MAEKRRPEYALSLFAREYQHRKVLTSSQPTSAEHKLALGLCADWRAWILAAHLKRNPEAAEHSRSAIRLLREAVAAGPQNSARRSALGQALLNHARFCLLPDRVADAKRDLQEAIGHIQFSYDQIRWTADRNRLYFGYRILANAHLLAKEFSPAATAAVRAGNITPTNPVAAFETVEQLHRCAAAARARSDRTPTDRETIAGSLLDMAEPFRAVAAQAVPTSDAGKVLLGQWLIAPADAPPAHLEPIPEPQRPGM